MKLKEFHIPAYVSEFPQMSEGRAWQTKYTLLCFAAAFLLSAALTYLVEKPAGRALLRLRMPPQDASQPPAPQPPPPASAP